MTALRNPRTAREVELAPVAVELIRRLRQQEIRYGAVEYGAVTRVARDLGISVATAREWAAQSGLNYGVQKVYRAMTPKQELAMIEEAMAKVRGR